MPNATPIDDKVIIKVHDPASITRYGIVLPENAQEQPQKGHVVAVGPGNWDKKAQKRIPLDVQLGDPVIFSRYGGTKVDIDGDEFLIIAQKDIHCVLELTDDDE